MSEKSTVARRKIESDGLTGAFATGFEDLYRYVLPKLNIVDSDSIGVVHADDLISRRSDSTMWTIPDRVTSEMSADICRRVPRRMILPSGSIFNDVEVHHVPEPQVFEFHDAYLTPPDSLAISSDHKIIKPVIASCSSGNYRTDIALTNMLVKNRSIYRSLQRNRLHRCTSETLDVACPLVTLWPNYYHWVAECLPKLYALEHYQQQTGLKPTLVLPSDPSSWMIESLELAGYGPDDWIICDDQVYKINKLVFPTYPDPAPEQCFWLRQRVSAESRSYENTERIYISRENATRRRVANRSEVLELLSQYGFESYELENLKVKDQVELFNNAEIVVAPHGAGIVNTIFSHNPIIIELFGRKRKTTFYRLAKMLDLTYDWLFCQPKKCDIQVNVDQLEKKVEQYLQTYEH